MASGNQAMDGMGLQALDEGADGDPERAQTGQCDAGPPVQGGRREQGVRRPRAEVSK